MPFPLRIDLFEQLIYDMRNRPGGFGMPGVSYELPPMAEGDVDILHELVTNWRSSDDLTGTPFSPWKSLTTQVGIMNYAQLVLQT